MVIALNVAVFWKQRSIQFEIVLFLKLYGLLWFQGELMMFFFSLCHSMNGSYGIYRIKGVVVMLILIG